MKIKHIDLFSRQIKIPSELAKNNTSEIIEIPEVLLKEIQYINISQYDENFFLFGKFGIPGSIALGKNTLRNRFNRFRDILGISEEKKFYSWKHTGAIALINNGAHPYDVKEHLRHKQFETTEKYLKNKTKYRNKISDKIPNI